MILSPSNAVDCKCDFLLDTSRSFYFFVRFSFIFFFLSLPFVPLFSVFPESAVNFLGAELNRPRERFSLFETLVRRPDEISTGRTFKLTRPRIYPRKNQVGT